MNDINRIYNTKNPYQGIYKKVLCVCSAGLLRSPTAALALSFPPFNFNTRSCGLDSGHALIILDNVLLEWADEIVCMTDQQKSYIEKLIKKPIINLQIEDDFEYRDPRLISLIRDKYMEKTQWQI